MVAGEVKKLANDTKSSLGKTRAAVGHIERPLACLNEILSVHRSGVDKVMRQIDFLKQLGTSSAA